jgi:hypothetical protein
MDDETGLQLRLVGFDLKEPTAHNKGKPEAIATLRHTFPYETIVMVGDGITGPPVILHCMHHSRRTKWDNMRGHSTSVIHQGTAIVSEWH